MAHEILVDVTRLYSRLLNGRLPTGVDRVNLAYLAHYRSAARALLRWAGRGWLLPAAQSRQLFDCLLDAPRRLRREAPLLLAHGVALNAFAPAPNAPVLFNTSHSGLELPLYPRLIRQLGAKPICFIHDLIPLTHPEYCRAVEYARHARRMDTVLAHAAGIIANSQDTLNQLAAYAARQHHALPPAVVAHLAPGLARTEPGPRPLAGPYFVMLSTIEPRKNHLLILHLWRQLSERLGEATPTLLVIGQRGWKYENVADLLERCPALRGSVRELPVCSDAEVATYLQHAQALLFPTFVEGYGLPLLEALALGVPVIASELPVFREIAGQIPDYLDPLDGLGWAQAVTEFAHPDSPRRAAQLRRLDHFRAPTWAQHFAVVDDLLTQVQHG